MKYRLAFLLLALARGARAEEPVCHYTQAAALPVTFAGGVIATQGILDGQPIGLIVDTGCGAPRGATATTAEAWTDCPTSRRCCSARTSCPPITCCSR